MSLCFDLSAAAHERAGLGRYAASLARALLDLGVPLAAFLNDPRESHLKPPLSALPTYTAGLPRKRWRLRAAWSYFGGPDMRRALPGVTVFHATEHLLPVLPGARSVFTLHDTAYLLFPQHHLLQNRVYLTVMMPRFLARADRVICVSENTRRDALRFYRLDPAKVVVIPEGVEPRFQPADDPARLAELRQRYGLPERYLLSVCTLEPRKNLVTLLDAYAALRARHPGVGLVLAGGKGWLYESVFDRLRALGLENQVVLPGFVPDEDLPALIRGAAAFAYPSVFEGFGLPPLEAMACGTPVVVSDASSLPEVVGAAGVLLPPHDPAAWAQALERVLSDADWRADLSARGLARARQFTWEAAARRTLALYTELGLRGTPEAGA